MNHRLGPAAPAASSPEAEALRRFRTFVTSSLRRGQELPPALDGLRVNQRRTEALIDAWLEAALRVAAGRDEAAIRAVLSPYVARFRIHLRGTSSGRKARGTPRTARRKVTAAIDRISEAFLAIDTDTGEIEDANPAAGSLLGVNRDALLGVDAMSFVPEASRSRWWTELDAVSEGDEVRRFEATLVDTRTNVIDVEASVTRFARRNRTLALVLLRPRARVGESVQSAI